MVDLITAIELKDALATHKKVTDRVLEVALYIGNRKGDMLKEKNPTWRLQLWNINSYRDGREDSCNVTLQCDWHKRPVTKKFGNPEDDDECDYRHDSEITRHIHFPARYLTTSGWEEEVDKKATFDALWWLDHNHKDLVDRALPEAITRVADVRALITKNRQERSALLEKNGLSEDATEEDYREALFRSS